MIMQRKATDELDSLNTIYRDSLSLNTKIAIFSLKDQTISLLAEVILLTVEYFQLASQAILTQNDIAGTPQFEGSWSSAIMYLAKVLNPGNLFEFQQEDKFTFSVLIIVLACTLLKYLLFGYVFFIALRTISPNNLLIKIWKWVFKFQGRCLYFVITSFWINTIIAALNEKIQIFPFGISGTVASFGILIIAEYIFSLFLNLRYDYILQTKSFLSSKGHQTQSITLTQKFAIQFLQGVLASYSVENYWLFGALGLLLNIIHCWHYLKTLPLYNIKALQYQGVFMMIIASLNLSCCLRPVIRSLDYSDNLDMLLMLWIIFSLLIIKIFYGYLKRVILNLVTQSSRVSPNLSIHKLSAIKQTRRKKRAPGDSNDQYEHSYLVNTTMETNLAAILDLEIDIDRDEKKSLNRKQWFNKLFILYLETLLQRFPQNNFIKLQIAAFYAKKLKLYGISMKFLTQLQHVKTTSIALSATLLIDEIQAFIRTKIPPHEASINVYTYFKNQKEFADLRKRMLLQCKTQIDLYKEMTSAKPDLSKIFNDALAVNTLKKEIEKEIIRKINVLPDYFIEVFALSGHYYSILNHSLNDSAKFFRLHFHKYKKYEKIFLHENLACENYYQENTGYILVSGQKERLGQIIFATNTISDIFGGDTAQYFGTDISTIVPLDFQSLYSLYFNPSRENNSVLPMSQVFRGYSYHKEGYLIELDFHLDVFPFLTQGFYFCLFVRPVETQKEYLLIHENGDIEGATKLVSQQLGIEKSLHPSHMTVLNIKLISEELADVNNAFNLVASGNVQINSQQESPKLRPRAASVKRSTNKIPSSPPLKPQADRSINGNADRALKLYSAFAIEGKEIQLSPIIRRNRGETEDGRRLNYYCKMETVTFGSQHMKLVILEENKKANANSNILDEERPATLRLKKLITIRDNGTKANIENKEDSNSEENSENFNFSMLEDEKQREVMNIGSKVYRRAGTSLSGPKDPLISMVGGDLATTEGNLLSPLSIGRIQTTQTVPLLEKSPLRIASNYQTKNIVLSSAGTLPDQKREKKKTNYIEKDTNSKTSPRSKIFKDNRISKILDNALTIRYYSTFNKIFCLFIFISLACVLAGQIYLKVTLDDAIQDLRVKKELIRNSQSRDFYLVSIYRACRFAWDLGTGQILPSQLGAAATFTVTTYINATLSSLSALANANQDIFLNTGLLKENVRENLFRDDVRMFHIASNGQETFSNYTNFQATDRIIETGFKAMTEAKASMVTSKMEMEFIFRNALNDLLLKSEDTSSLFLGSIQDRIDDTTENIISFLIARVVVLISLFLSFLGAAFRQYLEEKAKLLSLIKLDAKKVQDLQARFYNFQNALESGSYNQNNNYLKGFLSSKKSTDLDLVKKIQGHKTTQKPNLRGMIKKYSFYVGKSLFCILIILAFILWTSLLGSDQIKSLRNEQTKFYFASDMATKTNFAFLVSQEIFASDNKAIIRNDNISSQFQKSNSDLAQMRNEAITIFADENNEYEPTIENVLFIDGCQLMNSTTKPYCAIVQKKALRTNVISLLIDYEMLLEDKFDKFQSSNGTGQDLRSIQTENYDLILSMQRILADESTLLSQIVDSNFERKFENVKSQASLGLGLFFATFTIIIILLWIFVLKEMIENDNKFKQALKTFPPGMILSNFILKSFVNRTSNEALQLIRNNI